MVRSGPRRAKAFRPPGAVYSSQYPSSQRTVSAAPSTARFDEVQPAGDGGFADAGGPSQPQAVLVAVDGLRAFDGGPRLEVDVDDDLDLVGDDQAVTEVRDRLGLGGGEGAGDDGDVDGELLFVLRIPGGPVGFAGGAQLGGHGGEGVDHRVLLGWVRRHSQRNGGLTPGTVRASADGATAGCDSARGAGQVLLRGTGARYAVRARCGLWTGGRGVSNRYRSGQTGTGGAAVDETRAQDRINDVISGRLAWADLDPAEHRAVNIAIDAAIAERAATVSIAQELLDAGLDAVVLDGAGKVVVLHPDGSLGRPDAV